MAFPERLDMGPFMAADCLDEQPAEYQLFAVVVHLDWGCSTDYGACPASGGGAWLALVRPRRTGRSAALD